MAQSGSNFERAGSNLNFVESGKFEPCFILPGTDCSPPKIMTLDHVQNTFKNLQDMTLNKNVLHKAF